MNREAGEPAGSDGERAEAHRPARDRVGQSRAAKLDAEESSPRLQSIWMTSARLCAGLLTIAIPLVLVRMISQAEFGYYKQIFLVAATAQALLSLGVPGSLYYFVPRRREEGHSYQSQSLWLLLALGVLGGGLTLLGGTAVQRLFHADLERFIPLLALFVALAIPATMVPVAPMVDRRARLAATMVVALDVTRAGLLIGTALITRDLFWILAAACLAVALRLGCAVWYLWRAGTGETWLPNLHRLRTQLAYALPFSGAAAIGFARQKIHAYFVAAVFSAESFAVYAAATINIPFIGQLSQTVEEVVVLENAAHDSGGRRAEMRRVWHRASHLLGLAMIPVWLIAEAFAPELIELLYGQPYAAATPIFRIFLFMLPLSVFLGSPMLRAAGDTRMMVWADTVALLVAVSVLIGFAGTFGPLAAVGSLVSGKAAYMLAAAGRTARHLDLPAWRLLPWRRLAGVMAAAGVSALAAERAAVAMGIQGPTKLLLGGTTAVILYAAICWITGLLPDSEKRWLRDRLSRRLRRPGATSGPGRARGPEREAGA